MLNLFEQEENEWFHKLTPILIKYKGRKHPLNYQNEYQLVIMVILSAQDSDKNINMIAPMFFKAFSNFENLAKATKNQLKPYLFLVENFDNKSNWLIETASLLHKNKIIPVTMHELTSLKGIGRKSANVIMREIKIPSEGIIVDLHVLRVSYKIGLTTQERNALQAEKQLMQRFPKNIWGEIGMAISFLGREICRPKPNCTICPINISCKYYNKLNL